MGIQVGFMAFPDAEELALVGPWEIIRMWAREPGGPARCMVVAERAEPIVCAKGLKILPDCTFGDCPKLDYLLVPGGMGTRREVDNALVVEFIAHQAQNCRAVLSVCTGVFLLEKAGLLAGRRATTHWRSLARLRQCVDVTVVESRFVHDGLVWSSAGVSAGIDMALAFVAVEAGLEVAGRVQLNAEYYPAVTVYRGDDLPEWTPPYTRT